MEKDKSSHSNYCEFGKNKDFQKRGLGCSKANKEMTEIFLSANALQQHLFKGEEHWFIIKTSVITKI